MRRKGIVLPRVLVVAPRLEVGGTEMHLTRVLPELRRQGLDVSVFALGRGGALEDQLLRNHVPVSGPTSSSLGLFARLYNVLVLRRELRRLRPDIVHFFLPEPYLIGSVASAGMRNLTRIMSRRSLAVYQEKRSIVARIERWFHGFTDILLGNSTAVVEQLVRECGDRGKIGLIYNGIEVLPLASADQRRELRRELGVPDDAFVFVVSANFFAYKGHGDLFDALALMKGRLSEPWRLLLIGRDQGAAAALRQKALAGGFANNIVWVEGRADARTLLDAADLAVVPSHQEGFSNSLIEEMACALPVVATRVGGNLDAIVDDESGLLVPVGDPSALMAAILRLHDDIVVRQRLGKAARFRVNELFSLDGCVQRYVNLYTRALAGGSSVQQMIDSPAAP